jgi:hypothetical protein
MYVGGNHAVWDNDMMFSSDTLPVTQMMLEATDFSSGVTLAKRLSQVSGIVIERA